MSDEWPGEAFLCCCNTHAVHVMVDDDGVEFAIWEHAARPESWRQRLRHVWRVLRHGSPYGDQISLSPEEAQRLGRKLLGAGSKWDAPYTFTSVSSNSTAGSGAVIWNRPR